MTLRHLFLFVPILSDLYSKSISCVWEFMLYCFIVAEQVS